MSLWKYKYFVDVVDLKSFTKAGKKNYVTQTAVSQQIADLEKRVGGKLLYRDPSGLKVTELGQIVYDNAKRMLETNEQMEQEIQQYKDKYVIKIGIDSSINKYLWRKMQDMIDEYYSEDDFQFSKVDGSVGSKMLYDYAVDIYIGYGMEEKYRKDGIEEFAITEEPIGVYVGKNSTIRNAPEISLEDLKGYTRYAAAIYPCSDVEIPDKELQHIFGEKEYVNNTETMKLKVEFNDGYAFVDSYYFSQCSGDILLLSDLECSQRIKVFYRKNRNKKKMNDVLSKLKNIMQE